MALIKEIWIKALLMSFLEKADWLLEAEDLAVHLDAGGTTLNLAHAGADPAVLVNNNVWPMNVQRLSETPGQVVLDFLNTEPSVIYNKDSQQYAYDKIKGDVDRHRDALAKTIRRRSAYNIAPSSHTAATPVLATTGAVTGGRKRLQFEDVIALGAAFDAADIDPEGRVLVLSTAHHEDLSRANLTLYNQLMSGNKVDDNFSFKIARSNSTPVYNSTTGAKSALGSSENPGATQWKSSLAFHKKSIGRVLGATKFFSAEDDPTYAGTVVSFQQHFLTLPIRSYGFAALINGI